jgi:hypothetical protein
MVVKLNGVEFQDRFFQTRRLPSETPSSAVRRGGGGKLSALSWRPRCTRKTTWPCRSSRKRGDVACAGELQVRLGDPGVPSRCRLTITPLCVQRWLTHFCAVEKRRLLRRGGPRRKCGPTARGAGRGVQKWRCRQAHRLGRARWVLCCCVDEADWPRRHGRVPTHDA